MKNKMTEEERKRYFGILVEDLYSRLKIISEGTIDEDRKKEIAAKEIYEFYEEYKEKYGIKSIDEIMKELDRVNASMEKTNKLSKETEKEER